MLPILFTIVLVFGSSAGALHSQLSLGNSTQNNFNGQFSFHVQEDVNGWEIVFTFSVPVDKCQQQTGTLFSKSSDKKSFTIVNTPDAGIVPAGSDVIVHVTCEYQGSGSAPSGSVPSGSAIFTNLGKDWFAPPAVKLNTDGSKYNLNEVLQKSILFYEAQRSGKLPANNRIPWRGDSALHDRGDLGEDLTGGWYDAGDHVKFTFPMAYSVSTLNWGLLQFLDAYRDSGQLEYMYDCVRWPLEYLMKCHPQNNTLYLQVGDGTLDHNYWGRPENMTMARPALQLNATFPGSDAAGEVAAALASGYIVFKDKDPAFANVMLQHAKSLFDFAEKYQGTYSDSLTGDFYGSTNYHDELCWAGTWLYMATQEQEYLKKAENYYIAGSDWGLNWDDKLSGCMVLLYNITRHDKYLGDIEATFTEWMPGGSIPYTPKGLVFRLKWGSNRFAANMAMIAIMAAEQGIHPAQYRRWAESQINYILGDNGRSYVVGFGTNPPTHPHHRASSCPFYPAPCTHANLQTSAPSPHVLYGGLVGGPGQHDEYADSRLDYVRNEVACDYNSGFQSAVAGLKSLYMRHEMQSV